MRAELFRGLFRAWSLEQMLPDAIISPRLDASLGVFTGVRVSMSPRHLCRQDQEKGQLERLKPMSQHPGEVSYVLGPIHSHTSALFVSVSMYGHLLPCWVEEGLSEGQKVRNGLFPRRAMTRPSAAPHPGGSASVHGMSTASTCSAAPPRRCPPASASPAWCHCPPRLPLPRRCPRKVGPHLSSLTPQG